MTAPVSTSPLSYGSSPKPPSPSLADRFSALGGEQRVRLLRRMVETGRVREIPAVVPPRDPARPVRLSPAQQDLWVYESLYPGTPALNLCCAYHFDEAENGPVDPAHLESALSLIQRHHDILRTRVTETPDGELSVDFPDTGAFVLEREDLRGTGTTVGQAFDTFRRRPFDLGRDRLIRGRFVQVDERRTTLMLSVHHVIADWWSFDVLQTEFAEAYRAVREGTKPRLTRPAVQYADFSSWQGELEEAGVFRERLDFWRRYLADLPGPLTAPGYGAAADDPERDLDGIVHVEFGLDAPTAAAIRALARNSGTTVYVVLMAAFAVLAHRVTGAEDMVLGTPVANRSAKGLEQVIGYVMNAVPTRWRVRPDSAFADLLTAFAADFPDLVANADLPVGRIVAATAPERSIGRSPLFQWVFMHLNQQPSVSAVREFAEPERIHTGGEHDLVGVVKDDGDVMIGSFEIRTDTFSPDAVTRWAECYVELLQRITAEPALRVRDIDLVPGPLRRHLLDVSTGPAAPAPASLPELVARQAARTPDAPALDTGAQILSYAQLVERIDRLAGELARRGAGPGRLVALALRRGTDWPVAALAVQRTGAAYLPLDPDHPGERLCRTLADARPVLVIAESAGFAAGTDVPVLTLGSAAFEGAAYDGPYPDPALAAYVIQTSGSTGVPKGVVVPHSGLAALAETLTDRFALGADSRVLQLGPPTFDISVADLCMAFGSGGTLVLPPDGVLVGDDLGSVLTQRRVSCVMVTPSVLATVPDGGYPDLRVLAVGAEACPPDLVARWSVGGRRFHNAYGPTEATVAVTLSAPLTADGTPPPLGTPVAGTDVRLLDEQLRPVPPGVRGELYLSGPLAHGYLHRPGQSAERFVADPYGPPGSRMYRTGDLAWRDDDGTTHYLGRTDDQVKLRGLRIEPAEITAALVEHPGVSRAVAVVREGAGGRPQLIGYVVPVPGHALEPETLLAYAAERLPAAFVPADVVILGALPLTSRGKIDRAALPAPVPRTPSAAPGRGSAAASGPQRKLCELFAEVLGVQQIDGDDDFFRLGGDSIMAIQLAARAAAAGLTLAPRDVFTARTPARLAALARPSAPEAPAEPDIAEGLLPLTPVMHWWREQDGPLGTFTQSMVLPVPDGIDLDRIRAAVRGLAERHAALRIRLLRHSEADWELEVRPGDGGAGARASRVAVPADTEPELLAAELAASAVLDPEQGEILRAVWLDAGPDRAGALLLTVHHLAVDGVSWRVLGPELARSLAGGAVESAGSSAASFTRWARLLQAEAQQAVGELPWWEEQLTGPDSMAAGAVEAGARRSTVTIELDAELTRNVLVTLPGVFHCGPDAVLLTALVRAAVRRRGTGSALLVQLEGHGREALSAPVDVSRTVGWFTTQYPVRLDPGASDAGVTAADALKRVKEQLRAVPSGGLGWGLLRYLHPEAGPGLAALTVPDVRFNYLGRFADGDTAGGRLLDPGPDAVPLAHALEIDALAREREGELRLEATFSYADGVLTEADAGELARLWTEELAALVADGADGGVSGNTPSDFPLVEMTVDQLSALEDDFGFDEDEDLGHEDDFGFDMADGVSDR